MIYLIEILKGVLMAFGIIIGFVVGLLIFGLVIVKLAKKHKTQYVAEDLVEPFENYLEKVKNEEWFEQIQEVEQIIQELKENVIPTSVENYKIKRDIALQTSDEDGNDMIRIITSYIIINKKSS